MHCVSAKAPGANYGPQPLGSAYSAPMKPVLAIFTAGMLTACTNSSDAPPVFGGEGAQVVSPNELPLAEGQGEVANGPCAKAAPAGDNPTLDDFEDGDNHLFNAFERDGWWFTATDDTPGTVEPRPDQFKPVLLPPEESTADNRYAVHLTATGFTDWGTVWGTSLDWSKEGLKCPFNASGFRGIRLRAKGNGRLRVAFGNPATIPPENGGTCQKGCYDTHGKMLDLTPEWAEYTVEFDKLQQGGWGTQAKFDPERVLVLNFAARPEWLPVDAWLDDIAFIPKDAPATPAGTAPAPAGADTASAVPTTSAPPTVTPGTPAP